ncbi:MAG TPA: molybdopterin-dependent oxidoreductase, partial [Candidatus Dormibacteraeota bacterium]|nr:molybdopterin-dependent oxidoreductase [Candidatus Dormibacteraeota bacterium]
MTRRQAALQGFPWGVVGGLAVVALMYLAALLLGLRPLPQILNEPLLSIMPGFVFGFLIDTLQHAGKVVEEFGLILAMVAGFGLVGAANSVASLRFRSRYLPFAFAAAGWVLVVGVLLPIGGSGFLGIGDGLATPIVWAALFAFYAVILQMGAEPARGVDPGRRQILSAVPLTIGGLSLGVLGFRLLPDWYKAIFLPPEAGLRGAPTAVTPVGNFYVVSKNFVDPTVDGNSWRLRVGGLVDKQMALTIADLRSLPSTTEYVTLECISNDVGGLLMSTGQFTGVSLRSLVQMASPSSAASWVAFKARDDYTESLPLSTIQASPEIMVAYDLDGAPLPMQHGFPARMVIPGHYGMKGPKWLENIELTTQETGGYWEQQGWDHNAVVRTTSRFDMPRDGDIVKLGPVALAGVAFAGTRGISKVEYTTDGGSTWIEAPFDPPLSTLTWVLWNATWTPSGEGAFKLQVRATDSSGAVQDPGNAASFPRGASGYHTVQINVS